MFDVKTVEIEWGGKTLTLETGRIARQADGAVLATYGETVVLCAVTAAKSVKEGQDFFPLTVHYQEKFFASGRIPGGFLTAMVFGVIGAWIGGMLMGHFGPALAGVSHSCEHLAVQGGSVALAVLLRLRIKPYPIRFVGPGKWTIDPWTGLRTRFVSAVTAAHKLRERNAAADLSRPPSAE